ncbi:MAG: hypothetical protein B6U72_04785 [Candidatus Altiarchaeales archaeon ex4484_2]|nr:MAG: hypothetical protein B6U72_04785 [Candidatus Altiarchaeales archaeon ex4484_2]
MEKKEMLKLIKEEGKIARRFFVMNSFDGILTVLGVLLAMYFFQQEDSRFVILSCMAPALGLMVSGIWSAYSIEKVERAKELDKIEEKMLRNLEKTKIGERLNLLVLMDSFINGISPLIVSMIIVSPFALSLLQFIEIQTAFHTSFALAGILLFGLGAFIGRIGEKNKTLTGLSMLVVGLLVATLLYVLNSSLRGV